MQEALLLPFLPEGLGGDHRELDSGVVGKTEWRGIGGPEEGADILLDVLEDDADAGVNEDGEGNIDVDVEDAALCTGIACANRALVLRSSGLVFWNLFPIFKPQNTKGIIAKGCRRCSTV